MTAKSKPAMALKRGRASFGLETMKGVSHTGPEGRALPSDGCIPFGQVLDGMDDLVMLCDTSPEHRLIYLNRKARQFFADRKGGSAAEEGLSGRSIHDFYRDPLAVREILSDPRRLPWSTVVAVGSMHFRASLQPIRDRDDPDRVLCYMASWRHIDADESLVFKPDSKTPLERSHAFYTALAEANTLFHQEQQLDDLFSGLSRIVVGHIGARAAWVGMAEDGALHVRGYSTEGREAEEVLQVLVIPFAGDDGVPLRSVAADAYLQQRPVVVNDYLARAEFAHWHLFLERHVVGAVAAFPVRIGDKPAGALVVCGNAGFFDDEVTSLLGRLADDLSRALTATGEERRRKDAEERLAYLADHDPLTGLPNRSLLEDRMRRALARRHRDMLGVALLDLDGFKAVNDAHGHAAGDRLLREVGRRLVATLREGDTVARLGGDEFVLLLAGLQDEGEARGLLDRALAALSEPYAVEGGRPSLGASAGVSLWDGSGPVPSPEHLLRQADQALYRAKNLGRRQYVFFDAGEAEMAQSLHQHQERVRAALERRELELRYQPKVHMGTGQVLGVEVLLRWRLPDGSLLSPNDFMPRIQQSSLIREITRWVMDRALADLALWRSAGLDLGIGVNIPPEMMRQAAFPADLQDCLRRHPEVPASAIELELLESTAIGDARAAAASIRDLQGIGARVALDDFGTGYSSLAYLRHLPVDVLKIDQQFVRDMLSDPEALSMVESILGLARAFGKVVVAEGVETEEHGRSLLELGCEFGQGFAIASAMPGPDLAAWVSAYQIPASWLEAGQRGGFHLSESPLIHARASHRYWLSALGAVMGGMNVPLKPEVVGDPHHCDFGTWYDGTGKALYGHLPEYAVLGELHLTLHREAGHFLDMYHAGRREEARTQLAILRRLSLGLLGALRRVEEAALRERDRGRSGEISGPGPSLC